MAFKSEESKLKFGIRFRAATFFYILLLVLAPYAAHHWAVIPLDNKYSVFHSLEGAYKTKNDIIIVARSMFYGYEPTREKIRLFSTHKKSFEPFKINTPGFILARGDENSAWCVYVDKILKFDGVNFAPEKLTISLPEYAKYSVIADATPQGLSLIYSDRIKNWLFTIDQKGNQNNVEIPCLQRCRSSDQPPCHCFSVGGNTLFYYQNQLWHFRRTWDNMYLQNISGGKASEWREVGEIPQICRTKDAHCRFFGGFDKNGIFFIVRDFSSDKDFFLRFDGQKLSSLRDYSISGLFYFPTIINSENSNALFFREVSMDFDKPIRQFEITDSGPKNEKIYMRTYNILLSYLLNILYVAIVLVVIVVYLRVIEGLMEKYKQKTDTGIVIAPLFQRAAAFLIDAVIFAIPLVIIAAVKEPLYFDPGYFVSARGAAVMAIWLTCYLLLISILEAEWGVSFGKLVMRLRVRTKDGKRPGLVKALVRNLLLIIDSLFGFVVAISFMAYTDDLQRLGDLAAGTVVVKSKKSDMPKEEK
jgi:uncharacterized RDD family membrane protein YckC